MPVKTTSYSLGIVGAGEIVANLHLPVLRTIPDVRVAWLVDINHERARKLGRAFQVESVPLPRDLEALPQADIILLAIPYGVRTPYYAAFCDRPCALYVEKPFAKSAEEHLSLCRLREPFQIACGFQRRGLASVNLIKAIIAGQVFGPLRRLEFGLGRRGHVRTGTHQANVEITGGGLLFEVGVHGLDALVYFTEAQDAWLQSASVIMHDGLDIHVDATFTVSPKFGTDVPCRLKVSCLEDTIESFKCEFDGTELSFSIFDNSPVRAFTRSRGHSFFISPDTTRQAVTQYQSTYEHWTTFLNGLRSADANWTSAYTSLLTTKIVHEIYAEPQCALSRSC